MKSNCRKDSVETEIAAVGNLAILAIVNYYQ